MKSVIVNKKLIAAVECNNYLRRTIRYHPKVLYVRLFRKVECRTNICLLFECHAVVNSWSKVPVLYKVFFSVLSVCDSDHLGFLNKGHRVVRYFNL